MVLSLLLLACPRPADAQSYTIAPNPIGIVQDNSGHIVNGGCVWTYVAGTTTAVATYSDNAGTANSNPIKADSAGRFTAFLIAGSSYKFVYENTPCTVSPPVHGPVLATRDNIAGVPSSAANVDVQGVAGQTLSAGTCAYLSDGSGAKTAGQWFPCDSANTYSSTTPEVGMVISAITSAATGTIRLQGSVSGLSSLSVGSEYFVGTTGAITTTAPVNARHLGHADTATSLILTGDPAPSHVTAANGQLPIGNGTGTTLATLTAGTGLTVTNGAGSITLTPSLGVLDKSTTEQSVTNTTTPTSVYSFSVPGGTLGTNKTLRLTLTGDYTNTSGGNSTLAFAVAYGGTSIAAGSFNTFATATTGPIKLVAYLNANGATNSQRGETDILAITSGSAIAAAAWGVPTPFSAFHDSVAVDSTTTQTFSVTLTHGAAASTITFKRFAAILEVLGQ